MPLGAHSSVTLFSASSSPPPAAVGSRNPLHRASHHMLRLASLFGLSLAATFLLTTATIGSRVVSRPYPLPARRRPWRRWAWPARSTRTFRPASASMMTTPAFWRRWGSLSVRAPSAPAHASRAPSHLAACPSPASPSPVSRPDFARSNPFARPTQRPLPGPSGERALRPARCDARPRVQPLMCSLPCQLQRHLVASLAQRRVHSLAADVSLLGSSRPPCRPARLQMPLLGCRRARVSGTAGQAHGCSCRRRVH